MKTNKHPEVHEIVAMCACGQSFKTSSTLPDLKVIRRRPAPGVGAGGGGVQFQTRAELRNWEPSPASGSVDAPAGAIPMLRLERTPITAASTAVRPNNRLLVRAIVPPSQRPEPQATGVGVAYASEPRPGHRRDVVDPCR